jgi:hypothetical protein
MKKIAINEVNLRLKREKNTWPEFVTFSGKYNKI